MQIPPLFADPKHEESFWAVEMAQQLIVKSLLPEDPSLLPNTHARQLTIACSSSCRGSNVSGLHGHPYACAEPHVLTIKIYLLRVFFILLSTREPLIPEL